MLLLQMATPATPVQFDAQLMAEDMAIKGWTKLDLARAAGVADMTVIRFLRAERQRPPIAKKLAEALGHTVERYLVSSRHRRVLEARTEPPADRADDIAQLALPMRRATDRVAEAS